MRVLMPLFRLVAAPAAAPVHALGGASGWLVYWLSPTLPAPTAREPGAGRLHEPRDCAARGRATPAARHSRRRGSGCGRARTWSRWHAR
ncbi:MAG: hypothetical protein MZW92_48855 [Comamonadaceae bacterium]|nr:hypothetical protein [Comamonadaceae bacterium]